MTRIQAPLALGILLAAAPVMAQTSASIAIDHPWARETATGQSVGGGFLFITNKGKFEDRLIGGSTPFAAQVQVHRMSLDGGIMRMRQLKEGLAVPAGDTVALKPGSFHIMFIGLKRPLKRGETIPVTLDFARAGKVAVRFTVEAITYGGQAHGAH